MWNYRYSYSTISGEEERQWGTERKQKSSALKSCLVVLHTVLLTSHSSCCLEVNWLCENRNICVGEVIKRVLAKTNLAQKATVATQLSTEHRICRKKETACAYGTGFEWPCQKGA